MSKISKDCYKKIVYISHGYGGKEENLNEITDILKRCTELYPDYLFISPVNMWHSLYDITDYQQGLNMCLCLLQEMATEMWVFDENYMHSKGCVAEIEYCHKNGIPYRYVQKNQLGGDFY